MHIDFIVGRGRQEYKGGLNLPIHPSFKLRNCVYIDSWDVVKPDICADFTHVDFTMFGICRQHDPHNRIKIRIIFDWSTFFCGCIQGLFTQCRQIGRACDILVPLLSSEHNIPSDIKQTLWQPVFKLELVQGKYPLFDWTSSDPNKKIGKYVNSKLYLKINYSS
jgi:hypothetical protein